MTRQTALKLASHYELVAESFPATINTERLYADLLASEDDPKLLEILEPSFSAAHRQILTLVSAMNKTAEVLKAAIERAQQS